MVDITLIYILSSSLFISILAWCGVVVLFFSDDLLKHILMPLIAFSAGSILATAFFHFIPEAIIAGESTTVVFIWVTTGFCLFFIVEQIFNWQKTKYEVRTDHFRTDESISSDENHPTEKSVVSYLILIAGGIHNFVGGLAIGSSFLISAEVGIVTTIAATAHHLPQEFGDFGILVHGGWNKPRAFVVNFISALTIVPGALLAYYLSASINTVFLLAFAAGNFIYISCTNLIPEITHGQAHKIKENHGSSRSLKESISYQFIFLVGIMFIIWTRIQLN